MLARCARCQGTFSTDRYGVQVCPHCGSEILLQEPRGAAGAPPPSPPGAPPASAPPGAGPPPSSAPPSGAPPPGWGAPPPGAGWGAPPPWPPPPPGAWPPPPGAPPGPELPAPFAERRTRGFVASFVETWKLAALDPSSFFARVRVDQPRAAVLFAVVASTLGSWLASLFDFATSGARAAQVRLQIERLPGDVGGLRPLLERFAHQMGTGELAQRIVAAPLVAFVGLYVAAGIVHLLLLVLRGARRGFGATLTATGYASGLALLVAVPGCGAPVAMVWTTVVLVLGLAAIHRIGTGRATAAVLLPVVLLCACACVAAFLFAGAAMQAVSGTVNI